MTEPDTTAQVRVGQVWKNVHTGRSTTITAFGVETKQRPQQLGQKPSGELVMAAYVPVEESTVHHTANAPPGFERGYGDREDSFREHWRLVKEAPE